MNYIAGTAGEEVAILRARENAGRTRRCRKEKINGQRYVALNVDGLPLLNHPMERSARSTRQRRIVWQIAHGETPDVVRNHPR